MPRPGPQWGVRNPGQNVSYFWLPVVLQWNFRLSEQWSVFGEPGFAFRIVDPGDDKFQIMVLYAGGRWTIFRANRPDHARGLPRVLRRSLVPPLVLRAQVRTGFKESRRAALAAAKRRGEDSAERSEAEGAGPTRQTRPPVRRLGLNRGRRGELAGARL